MALGRFPGLRADRSGIAFIAAVLLVAVTGTEIRRDGGRLSPDLAAIYCSVLCYLAEALGDPVLWEKIKTCARSEYSERVSEDLEAQWEACINFDCDEGLKTCPVPMHVISFS